MYSAQKLNKQGDNIQPCHTPFPIWNQSVVPCPVLTVASWSVYRFLKRQVRWSGIPISFRIVHSLLWSTQSFKKWSEVAQLCPTLCDSMDYSLPGSSNHGIFQARILEWVSISFSKRSSRPRDWTHVSWVSCIDRWIFFFTTEPSGKPWNCPTLDHFFMWNKQVSF